MATLATFADEGSPAPHLDETIGAAFIGLILSTLLFGTSNLQLYIYYLKYPEDWIVFKVSVAALWLLDGLNLLFTIQAVYYYLVSNFGRYDRLYIVVWSFKAQVLSNIVIIVGVQSLYTIRLWRLDAHMNYQKRWYPKLVPLAIVLGTAVGVALTIKTMRLQNFSQLEQMKWATYSAFATTVVVDTCIAVATICYLQGSKTVNNGWINPFRCTTHSLPRHSWTNSTLTSLVIWVLSTGVATSFFSLLALIMYACFPEKLVFLAVEFLLSKLYFNSFMAFLNARNHIKEQPSNVLIIDGLQSQSLPRITLAATSKSDAPSHPEDHRERKSVPTFAVET